MESKSASKFGTFAGVMVPSMLAILGAVMYLIVPKVLGGVGLFKMLLIILLAHSITIATAFSISAIATNIKVKGGGLYYLISRSLGREFGGSMGIQLFLAQTIAAAFYTIAFTKALHALLLTIGYNLPETYLAMGCMGLFFLVAFRGAKFVIKLQYLILITIILSLAAMFLAPNASNYTEHLLGDNGIGIPFWIAFALFFPAVTGIDAGVGMSGDLKNPRKSLVSGTFLSIFITMAIYIALVIKLSYAANPMLLSLDPMVMVNIVNWPFIIYAGIMVATISSALSCLMTAPRSLRAMVEDGIFSNKFQFIGKSFFGNEPHVALICSLIIAEVVLYFGGLDLVSQIVAMFFLNVYGWINGAAFLESISRNPSFRPTFKSPLIVSFYGMISCYFVMFLFNPWVMFGGIAFQVILFLWLSKTKASSRFESVWAGIEFQFLRGILNSISEHDRERKNWRPTILAFGMNELNHTPLLSILDWINSNRSIMKMYALVKGAFESRMEQREEIEKSIKNHIKEYNLDIFPRVIISRDIRTTINSIMQAETIGNVPLNTILIDYDERVDLVNLANDSLELKKNFIILRNKAGFSDFKKVDVWWKDQQKGNLSLLLAYLITHSQKWRENDATIRVFTVVKKQKEIASAKEKVQRLLAQSRIENVEVEVILRKQNDIDECIHEHSRYADLVIMGIQTNTNGKVDKQALAAVKKNSEKLSTSLFVLAADKIDFKVN